MLLSVDNNTMRSIPSSSGRRWLGPADVLPPVNAVVFLFVVLQTHFVVERLHAQLTLVGLHPGVDTLVLLHVALLREAAAALTTLVRLLLHVYSGVDDQPVVCVEGLPTVVADEGLLSTMVQLVAAEVLRKAVGLVAQLTLVAVPGAVHLVHLLVLLQYLILGKALATLLTDEVALPVFSLVDGHVVYKLLALWTLPQQSGQLGDIG